MPIALSPDRTVEVCLDIDKPKPEESRPRFVYQFLSCRQMIQIDEILNQAMGLMTDGDRGKLLLQALNVGFVRAVNMPTTNSDALMDLTIGELWELVGNRATAVRVAETDRKNSDSAQQSAAGNSAPTVPAPAASV